MHTCLRCLLSLYAIVCVSVQLRMAPHARSSLSMRVLQSELVIAGYFVTEAAIESIG